jgi:hypothetical protein
MNQALEDFSPEDYADAVRRINEGTAASASVARELDEQLGDPSERCGGDRSTCCAESFA